MELAEIDWAKKDGDMHKTKDPAQKLSLMTAWPMWVKLFTTYEPQEHRSVVVAGMLLAYDISDNDEVATDNLAYNDWNSVADNLVATFDFGGWNLIVW